MLLEGLMELRPAMDEAQTPRQGEITLPQNIRMYGFRHVIKRGSKSTLPAKYLISFVNIVSATDRRLKPNLTANLSLPAIFWMLLWSSSSPRIWYVLP
jgi:hypothetical protein